jgi:nitric oxide reductase NorQ protein
MRPFRTSVQSITAVVGVSTRLPVYCAILIRSGVKPERAVRTAMIEPLTDDPDLRQALLRVAQATLR